MKQAKKFAALLLAVLMIALMVLPAGAATYTEVAVSSYNEGTGITGTGATSLGLKESFQTLEAGAINPTVTYTLKLDSEINVYTNAGKTYGSIAFVKNPLTSDTQIATVTIPAGDVPYGPAKEYNYNYNTDFLAALNAMSFTAPGIYYWNISKEKSTSDSSVTNNNLSAASPTGTALIVQVDDVSGALKVVRVQTAVTDSVGGPPNGNKDPIYRDNYPATPGTLILEKEVTGNQGAKDQYFKFTITLTGMTGIVGVDIPVDVTHGNSVKSATVAKYGEEFTPGTTDNSTVTLTVQPDGSATGVFWLLHEESITISSLPASAKYTIIEDAAVGYTTTYTINGGTPVSSNNTGEQSLSSSSGDRVIFKNDKATTTPTGILLEAGAPLAGLAVVGGLATALFLTKRKKEQQA